jgi:hypothetical protein
LIMFKNLKSAASPAVKYLFYMLFGDITTISTAR